MVHSMAHSLGGYYDLSHGLCNGIMLDYVFDFNFESASEQYFRVAEALGLDLNGLSYVQKKSKIQENLISFKKSIGISQSLSEMGVTKEDIPLLARHVLNDPCLVTNPRAPSLKDIENIYERAL
jgi:alcohol dehydrogenase class IV